jgi:diguanylate cyclase (GGDEF)-like protein
MAAMFAAGGLQGLLIFFLPRWPMTHPALVLGIEIGAVASAPLIWLARRRLLTGAAQHIAAVAATAVLSASLWAASGPAGLSGAFLYFWIALYAVAYFRAYQATLHLVNIGLMYAVALWLDPAPQYFVQWFQAMFALWATAFVVGGFAHRMRAAYGELDYQARHDELTGLPNRRAFIERVDRALHEAHLRPTPVAVVYLDLDDFKTVNESLNHPAGDALLQEVGQRLRTLVADPDALARMGGDEFAVLVEFGPMPQTAELMAKHIARALEPPVIVGDVEVGVRASVGIALGTPFHERAVDLLRDADMALYVAKQRGKGRYELVNARLWDKALGHFVMVTDLRRAIANGEFELYWQPIVGASDHHPVAAEALLRWHHPSLGMVAPLTFIPTAESSGLILPIGDWVIGEACRQLAEWRADGIVDRNFSVTVNVSPRQFGEQPFVDTIVRALRVNGLDPSDLVLEMTESTLMSDITLGLAQLGELKRIGVRLAMDDYGTGHSSLRRLRSFPLDIVKIDKSYVDHVNRGGPDEAIVHAMIDVMRAIGMVSIAEGIESPAQAETLAEWRCDALQGWLFAKAQSAEDTGKTLVRLAEAATRHTMAGRQS